MSSPEAKEYTYKHPVLEEVFELLNDRPDAKMFLATYCDYCHRLDDIIDEKITDSEYILKTAAMAADIFNSNFWRDNCNLLYVIEALVNNDYADANVWQGNAVEWKRNQADILRHSGNNMIFAVILLTKGREALRRFSGQIREVSHLMHHDPETGKPV